MIQATVKRADLKRFAGLMVTKIEIGPYVVSLFFGHDKQLDIVTHWELIDTKTNTLLDRALGLQLRENFFLFKVINKKLLSFAKTQYQVEFIFEDHLKLLVL